MGDKAAPVLSFFSSLAFLTSSMMDFVLTYLAPPGLVSLVATQVVWSKVLKNIRSLSKVVIVVQPSAALAQLAKFLLTVILGDLKKKLRTPQVCSRNYCL